MLAPISFIFSTHLFICLIAPTYCLICSGVFQSSVAVPFINCHSQYDMYSSSQYKSKIASCLLVYQSGIERSRKFSAYIEMSLLFPCSTSYAHSFMNLFISSSDASCHAGKYFFTSSALARFQLCAYSYVIALYASCNVLV